MGHLELVAAALGVANIVLLIRRSIWNYAFGLAMVACYAPVFFQQRLYSDALLQLFFFGVQLYGWVNWRRAMAESGDVRVERLDWGSRGRWALAAGAAWLVWASAMHRFTDAAYPYWDGAVAVMSVTAQILLARRLIENWPLWVAVDVIGIALFLARDLKPTALLYAIFLLLSLAGWRNWSRVGKAAAV